MNDLVEFGESRGLLFNITIQELEDCAGQSTVLDSILDCLLDLQSAKELGSVESLRSALENMPHGLRTPDTEAAEARVQLLLEHELAIEDALEKIESGLVTTGMDDLQRAVAAAEVVGLVGETLLKGMSVLDAMEDDDCDAEDEDAVLRAIVRTSMRMSNIHGATSRKSSKSESSSKSSKVVCDNNEVGDVLRRSKVNDDVAIPTKRSDERRPSVAGKVSAPRRQDSKLDGTRRVSAGSGKDRKSRAMAIVSKLNSQSTTRGNKDEEIRESILRARVAVQDHILGVEINQDLEYEDGRRRLGEDEAGKSAEVWLTSVSCPEIPESPSGYNRGLFAEGLDKSDMTKGPQASTEEEEHGLLMGSLTKYTDRVSFALTQLREEVEELHAQIKDLRGAENNPARHTQTLPQVGQISKEPEGASCIDDDSDLELDDSTRIELELEAAQRHSLRQQTLLTDTEKCWLASETELAESRRNSFRQQALQTDTEKCLLASQTELAELRRSHKAELDAMAKMKAMRQSVMAMPQSSDVGQTQAQLEAAKEELTLLQSEQEAQNKELTHLRQALDDEHQSAMQFLKSELTERQEQLETRSSEMAALKTTADRGAEALAAMELLRAELRAGSERSDSNSNSASPVKEDGDSVAPAPASPPRMPELQQPKPSDGRPLETVSRACSPAFVETLTQNESMVHRACSPMFAEALEQPGSSLAELERAALEQTQWHQEREVLVRERDLLRQVAENNLAEAEITATTAVSELRMVKEAAERGQQAAEAKLRTVQAAAQEVTKSHRGADAALAEAAALSLAAGVPPCHDQLPEPVWMPSCVEPRPLQSPDLGSSLKDDDSAAADDWLGHWLQPANPPGPPGDFVGERPSPPSPPRHSPDFEQCQDNLASRPRSVQASRLATLLEDDDNRVALSGRARSLPPKLIETNPTAEPAVSNLPPVELASSPDPDSVSSGDEWMMRPGSQTPTQADRWTRRVQPGARLIPVATTAAGQVLPPSPSTTRPHSAPVKRTQML